MVFLAIDEVDKIKLRTMLIVYMDMLENQRAQRIARGNEVPDLLESTIEWTKGFERRLKDAS